MTERQRLDTLRRALRHLKNTTQGYRSYAESGRGTEWAAAMRDLKVLEKDLLPDPATRLVEPKQGFGSLERKLWVAYSQGRNLGMSDLGTYNPASRLPSGRPSDHAVYPARAFDLGFSPATGYANPVASKFFRSMIGRSEVNYVICGDRIWSRARGLHRYTAGGHEGHVHVSGVS